MQKFGWCKSYKRIALYNVGETSTYGGKEPDNLSILSEYNSHWVLSTSSLVQN